MPNTGYLHGAYASTLGDLGRPRGLPRSGGWILEREVQGTPFWDAMGCYPLFCCHDWSALPQDLDEIGGDLVALSAVIDPFGEPRAETLQTAFPDLVAPFKQHYVVDLSVPIGDVLGAHHRRNVRKGQARVSVECFRNATHLADEWVRLYALLTDRHDVRGFAAFSEASLRQQLGVPGMVAFRGRVGNRTVGITLWYAQGAVAYYHLGAYDAEGYEARAPYAIFAAAITSFAEAGLDWLNLGAGAGLRDDDSSGLARFKRGWSTGTRPTFLCGRVFDRTAYAQLTAAAGTAGTSYFPAYRAHDLA